MAKNSFLKSKLNHHHEDYDDIEISMVKECEAWQHRRRANARFRGRTKKTAKVSITNVVLLAAD